MGCMTSSQKIQERRRKLVPIMKQFRDEGKRATLSADKLIVYGIPRSKHHYLAVAYPSEATILHPNTDCSVPYSVFRLARWL